MERLDIRMVLALAKDPRNGLALFGDPQALVGTELLNVDRAMHDTELMLRSDEWKTVIASERSNPAFGMPDCFAPRIKSGVLAMTMAYFPRVFRRFVPSPIDLASVRRCSA